jgi:uncharacterized membrane protein YjgN (DUF898 family)
MLACRYISIGIHESWETCAGVINNITATKERMMENIQPQSRPPPVWNNFLFTGDSLEYFKIWIVNILLTIITVGLYSPWAKVRTLKYFYGNTWLNGSSFAYLADPVKILKGRLIAVFIFCLYWAVIQMYPAASFWALAVLCLLIPFILVTSMAFRMRNTAYRNIRFHFRADYGGAYRSFLIPIAVILILTGVVYWLFLASGIQPQMEAAGNDEFRKEDMLFSIFIMAVMPVFPYFDYLRRKFIVNQTQYGTARGSFNAKASEFYGVYAAAFIISIIVFFAIGFIMSGIFASIGLSGAGAQTASEAAGEFFIIGFITVLFIYGVMFFIMGYLKAEIANLTYNKTEFGTLRLQSHLRWSRIGWLYLTNTVALIFSLGLLIPWSMIRMARYVAESTEFLQDQIEGINATAQAERSAIGEEIGDLFDLDLGL